MKDYYKVLVEKCPFLTYGQYCEDDIIGIVQNCDNSIISIYIYTNIPDEKMRKIFITMGRTWWEESDRKLPINIFLKGQFKIFRPYLKTLAMKEWDLVCGPMPSLQETMTRRIKRRKIILNQHIKEQIEN